MQDNFTIIETQEALGNDGLYGRGGVDRNYGGAYYEPRGAIGTGLPIGISGGFNNLQASNFPLNSGLNALGIGSLPYADANNINNSNNAGNIAAINGLCDSLNVLNGTLGGLSGRLDTMKSATGIANFGGNNVTANMQPSNMMSTGGGIQSTSMLTTGNGMDLGVHSMSSMAPQHGEMNYSGISGGISNTFSGSLQYSNNYDGKMQNFSTSYGGNYYI